MKKQCFLFLIVMINGVLPGLCQINPVFLPIDKSELKDKIAGGWAGKMIGVTYGAPTEFKAQQKTFEEKIHWTPADVKGSLWQDDIYVQLTFMMAMDQFGIDVPASVLQEMLANAGYPLWCANMQARKNFFDNITPPASGHPDHNFRADDIDFQIEADYIGFMNPGMAGNVVDMCWKTGHIMNYGDGVYGGIFLGTMYSAAYFDDNLDVIINKGLSVLPPESEYACIIRDVINLHKHYPTDWRNAWKELDQKWGDTDISAAGSPFNIDAKINGAYIVMGLLYGDGDINKTLEITTRCGQDSDCNPSNAMALLGIMKGFSSFPVEIQQAIHSISDSLFINTSYSFNKAVNNTYKYAEDLILKNGGKLRENDYLVKIQEIPVAPFEVSFPGLIYKTTLTVFDTLFWTQSPDWKAFQSLSQNGKDLEIQSLVSEKQGAFLDLNFEGAGISLQGNWVKDGGIADIYLDDTLQCSIDTYYNYSNQEHRDVDLWHNFNMSPGKHSLTVLVKGMRNPASYGNNIYISKAIIFNKVQNKNLHPKFTNE
jgi:hypothetical protein